MSQHHTQYGDLPLYIGGEACPSASDEWIEVTDPADQHLLARVPKATSAEIELAVRAAHDAYLLWREVPAPERYGSGAGALSVERAYRNIAKNSYRA